MSGLLLVAAVVLGFGMRLLRAPDPPSGEPSDEELFAAYTAGDASAFDRLFARYGPALTRLMRRQVRSAEDAADLVQQTFLQLHRARNDFRTDALLRPWLYTIALNLRREYFRKLGRRKESAIPLDDRPADQPRSDPADLGLAETREQVRAALQRLPAGQRDVIQLHWFDGLSMAEVGAVVGASTSAVKVRAHRGYKALRAVLEATDAPESIGLSGNRAASETV